MEERHRDAGAGRRYLRLSDFHDDRHRAYAVAPEAVDWFERICAAVLKSPEGIFTGSLTLHEPRVVVLGTKIVERMIERGGRRRDSLC
jgi:hypothetical protein